MFELFRNAPDIAVGVMKPQEWPFIQRGFRKNIEKVMNFHKLYPRSVRGNHILVRLLQSLAVPKSMELERYYAAVDAKGLSMSMAMRMTSSINRGIFHKGVFYGDNNPEILVAVDDYFDFEEVDRNWENVSAVTTLLHPKSDMDIHIPNGDSYSAERGLAVILINVPMLAVQYRAFYRAQQQKEFGKNIMQFIGGYVLPNMLPIQTDICFFNRLSNRFYEKNDGKNISFRNHSFTLSDYGSYIDIAINKILTNIDRCNKRFDVALKQIPSFYNEDIYETLMMPDIAPTMQVSWILFLSRLSAISFLFDVCEPNTRSRNQSTINQILRSFRLDNSYKVLNEMLPDELYFEAQKYIDNILDRAHVRSY